MSLFLSPDDPLAAKPYDGPMCGIDEAGRGPWAGPVTAAAVIWPDGLEVPEHLNDSKKLTAKRRDVLFDYIIEHCDYSIAHASVEEIDRLNILAATKLAMQRAFNQLPEIPCTAFIDGNQPPKLPCRNVVSVIKGDGRLVPIAAASILAKVTRDRLMAELAKEYPYYKWESNAGYGAKVHQEGLNQHGITPHHRRSFAPIKRIIDAA